MTDSIHKVKFPELLFGFVAPIGADLAHTLREFRAYFHERGYRVIEVKATDVFPVLANYIPPARPLIHRTPLKDRYESYIAYGNQLRDRFGDSILAATTARRVMAKRLKVPAEEPFSKNVFLLHQFKRKEEIDLLRAVYGRLFFRCQSIQGAAQESITYLDDSQAAKTRPLLRNSAMSPKA